MSYMKCIKSYGDLLIEVDIIKERLEGLEREDYAATRSLDNHMNLERYVNRKNKINNEMAILQSTLEDKQRTIGEIKKLIDKFNGIEYKIAYKRFVERKSLNEIAQELNISYSWAMKKSAEISKKINKR